ncbi:unnamed protein product [Brassica oleracea]
MSAAKDSPAGLLTRDRGIIKIRDGESPLHPEETRGKTVKKLRRAMLTHRPLRMEPCYQVHAWKRKRPMYMYWTRKE